MRTEPAAASSRCIVSWTPGSSRLGWCRNVAMTARSSVAGAPPAARAPPPSCQGAPFRAAPPPPAPAHPPPHPRAPAARALGALLAEVAVRGALGLDQSHGRGLRGAVDLRDHVRRGVLRG